MDLRSVNPSEETERESAPPDSPRGGLERAFRSNRLWQERERAGVPADDWGDALRAIAELRRNLERQEDQIVFRMRLRGASWTDIGAELGISKQAAHERFAKSAGLLDELDTATGRTSLP
jgi:hypothetical protein